MRQMSKKTRIVFLYKSSDPFFTGHHSDNTSYEFLIMAMQNNKNIDYNIIPVSHEYDVGKLKNKCDAVILAGFRDYNMPKIHGLKALNVPILARIGDFHDVTRYGIGEDNYDDYGISCTFNFMSEKYFYEYYPAHMNYREIFFGIDPPLYENLTPYEDRIKHKILVSGAIQRYPYKPIMIYRRIRYFMKDIFKNPEKLPLKTRVLHQRPPFYHYYKLRSDCSHLGYVEYGRRIENESYPMMLSRYRGAIAATTYYPTIKYWEIAAAGCLTFMEITDKNHGSYLGFQDKKDCIVINEDNYKDRFEEYLADTDNPTWQRIAEAGRSYAMRKFNNNKAVEDILGLIEELS